MTSIKLVPQDFELVSGNDKTLRFTLTDENGDPVNLTGATIIWAFAKTATSKAWPIVSYPPTRTGVGGLEISIKASPAGALAT